MDVLVLIEGAPVEYVFNGPRVEKFLISGTETLGKVSPDGKIELDSNLSLDDPFVWQDANQHEGGVCLVRYERSDISQLLINDGQFFISSPELGSHWHNSITEVSPGVDDNGENFFIVKQNGRLSQVIFTNIETIPVTLNAFDPLPITAPEQKVYSSKGEKRKINNREVGNADYVINGTKLPAVFSFGAELILPSTIHQITTNRGSLPFTIKRRSTDNTTISGHPDATWILPDGRTLRGDLVLSGSIRGPVLLAADGGGAGLVVQVETEEVETLFCERCKEPYIEANNYHGACRWHTQHAQTINREMAQRLIGIDNFSTPEIEAQTFSYLVKRLPQPIKTIIETKLAYLSTAQLNRLSLTRSPLNMVVADLRGLIKDYSLSTNDQDEAVRRYARVVTHLLDERKLKDCLTLPYYDPNDPDQRVTSGFRNPNKRFGLLGDTWQCCGFSEEQGGCWVGRHSTSEFPDLQDAMNNVHGSEWLNEANTSEENYREIVAAKERKDYETMLALEGLYNEVQGAVLVIPSKADTGLEPLLKEVGAKLDNKTSSYWVRDIPKSLQYDGISTEDLLSRNEFSPPSAETEPVQLLVRPPSPRREEFQKLIPRPKAKTPSIFVLPPPKVLSQKEKEKQVSILQLRIEDIKNAIADEDWRTSQRLKVVFSFDFQVTAENIAEAEQTIALAQAKMRQWEDFKTKSRLELVSDYQSNVQLFVGYFRGLVQKQNNATIFIGPKKLQKHLTTVEKFMTATIKGEDFNINPLLDITEKAFDLLDDWKIVLPNFESNMKFTHSGSYKSMWNHFGYKIQRDTDFQMELDSILKLEAIVAKNFLLKKSYDDFLIVWKTLVFPSQLIFNDLQKIAVDLKAEENRIKKLATDQAEYKNLIAILNEWPDNLKSFYRALPSPELIEPVLEQQLKLAKALVLRNQNYFKNNADELKAAFEVIIPALESWQRFYPLLEAAMREKIDLSSKSINYYDTAYRSGKTRDVQKYLETTIATIYTRIDERYPLEDALKEKIVDLKNAPLKDSHIYKAVLANEAKKKAQFTPEQQMELTKYVVDMKKIIFDMEQNLIKVRSEIRSYIPDFGNDFHPSQYDELPQNVNEVFSDYIERLKQRDAAILNRLEAKLGEWEAQEKLQVEALKTLKSNYEAILKTTPEPKFPLFYVKLERLQSPISKSIEEWKKAIDIAQSRKNLAEKLVSFQPTLRQYDEKYGGSREKYALLKNDSAQFEALKKGFNQQNADEVSKAIIKLNASEASNFLVAGIDAAVRAVNAKLANGEFEGGELRKFFIENVTFFSSKPQDLEAEKIIEEAEKEINEISGEDRERIVLDIPTEIEKEAAQKALEEANQASNTASENKEAASSQVIINLEETRKKVDEVFKKINELPRTLELEGFIFKFEEDAGILLYWETLLTRKKDTSPKWATAVVDVENDFKNMVDNRKKCSNDFYAGVGQFRRFAEQFAFVLAVEKLSERPAVTRKSVLDSIDRSTEMAQLTYNIISKTAKSGDLRRRIFGDRVNFVYPEELPTPLVDIVNSDWAQTMLEKMATLKSLRKTIVLEKYFSSYQSIGTMISSVYYNINLRSLQQLQKEIADLENKKVQAPVLLLEDFKKTSATVGALRAILNRFRKSRNDKTTNAFLQQPLNAAEFNASQPKSPPVSFGEFEGKTYARAIVKLVPTMGPDFSDQLFDLNATYIYKGLEAMQDGTLEDIKKAKVAVQEYKPIAITPPETAQSYLGQIDSRVKLLQEEQFFDRKLFNQNNTSAIPVENVKLNAFRVLSSLLVGSVKKDQGGYQRVDNPDTRFAIVGLNAVWVLLQVLKASDFTLFLATLFAQNRDLSKLVVYYDLTNSKATIFVDTKNGDDYERELKIEISAAVYNVSPTFDVDLDSEDTDLRFKELAEQIKKVKLLAFIFDKSNETLNRNAIKELLRYNVLEFGFTTESGGFFFGGTNCLPYNSTWFSPTDVLKPEHVIPMRVFRINSAANNFNNFKPVEFGFGWNDILWDTGKYPVKTDSAFFLALDKEHPNDFKGRKIYKRWELVLAERDDDLYLVHIPSNSNLPKEQTQIPESQLPPKAPKGTPSKTGKTYDDLLEKFKEDPSALTSKKAKAVRLAENIYWNWRETEASKASETSTNFLGKPTLIGYPANYFNNLVWMLTFIEDKLTIAEIKKLAAAINDPWEEPKLENGRSPPPLTQVPAMHAKYHKDTAIIPLPFPIEDLTLLQHYYKLSSKYLSTRYAVRSTHATTTLEMGSRAERLWNARLADQNAFKQLREENNIEGLYKRTREKFSIRPKSKLEEFIVFNEDITYKDAENLVALIEAKKYPKLPSDITDSVAEIVSDTIGWNRSIQQKNAMKRFFNAENLVLAERPAELTDDLMEELRGEVQSKILFEKVPKEARQFVEYLVLTGITDARLDTLWKTVFSLYNQNTFMNESLWREASNDARIYSVVDLEVGDRVAHGITTLKKWEGSVSKLTYPNNKEIDKNSNILSIDEVVVRRGTNMGKIILMKAVLDFIAENNTDDLFVWLEPNREITVQIHQENNPQFLEVAERPKEGLVEVYADWGFKPDFPPQIPLQLTKLKDLNFEKVKNKNKVERIDTIRNWILGYLTGAPFSPYEEPAKNTDHYQPSNLFGLHSGKAGLPGYLETTVPFYQEPKTGYPQLMIPTYDEQGAVEDATNMFYPIKDAAVYQDTDAIKAIRGKLPREKTDLTSARNPIMGLLFEKQEDGSYAPAGSGAFSSWIDEWIPGEKQKLNSAFHPTEPMPINLLHQFHSSLVQLGFQTAQRLAQMK